jgi:hypothetical protein
MFETSIKFCVFWYQSWSISENFFLDLYYRMTKFSGAFPQRLWGRKKFFYACSGLPTHGHNYWKIIEFANKNFFQNQLPLLLTRQEPLENSIWFHAICVIDTEGTMSYNCDDTTKIKMLWHCPVNSLPYFNRSLCQFYLTLLGQHLKRRGVNSWEICSEG